MRYFSLEHEQIVFEINKITYSNHIPLKYNTLNHQISTHTGTALWGALRQQLLSRDTISTRQRCRNSGREHWERRRTARGHTKEHLS